MAEKAVPQKKSRPIAIVHIITKLELGGAQENTLFTVANIDRKKFRPFLFSGPGGLLERDAISLDGVKSVSIPHLKRELRPLSDLMALMEIRRQLAAVRKDNPGPLIVHTHSSKAGILGRWAARLAGAEIIIHSIHGFGFNPRQTAILRLFFIILERLTAKITTAFIAVSRANIVEGSRLRIFSPQSVNLIRSGIVIENFRRPRRDPVEVRRSLGFPEGSPVVGMIACFKPQKCPLDFVRMAGLVAARKPQARFIMVGDGLLRKEIEKAVAELDLEGKIHLLGWRRDIPDLLHVMDVLVLTSLWEGLPRVCPQAMSAGLPIVATAVDGVPEAVADDETGYVVQPGEVGEMAGKVLLLLNDPARAALFGKEGSRRVDEFDAGVMVRRQEELYHRLLDRFCLKHSNEDI